MGEEGSTPAKSGGGGGEKRRVKKEEEEEEEEESEEVEEGVVVEEGEAKAEQVEWCAMVRKRRGGMRKGSRTGLVRRCEEEEKEQK